jgi:hypothetical protein
MKYIFLFVVGTMLFFSCKYLGGKRVRGNGNFAVHERSISGFDGVECFGSFNVTLIPSSTTSVKVEADENLHQYIETYVDDDNNLNIREKDGYNLRPRNDIKITVSGPVFTTVSTAGSGTITGQGLLNTNNDDVKLRVAGSGDINVEMNATKIDSEIAGSGNINVKGTSKEFEGGVFGSGNIRAGDLRTEESKVEIAGIGSVEIFASNKLDVSIAGSGEVKHKGSAQVNAKITGSGSVIKVD